ncbi:MAG: hypothetical protein J07HN6_02692 [Halonotius sp. J07HN6]|nr:MAG: hypothetical protein J07HN6_02692 [Halonotius sp. J07HN6]ESS09064.1 MAG: hypothetical protein A07HN63_01274 [uncultured archaeon A07HN63]
MTVVAERDRVWTAVIRLSNEQAGFSAADIETACEELFGEDAPTAETIDDTTDAMLELDVLEPFGVDEESTYYVLKDAGEGP